MATQQRTVDYLLEQTTRAGAVSTKPIGEYGVFVDGKTIGSICADRQDDQGELWVREQVAQSGLTHR